uniref:MerR family transcriptional regulator n=1 Tax=Phenylobacterium glaciei TaxID=2803784 RepID=A0A974P223_9CAUL|nr:MerR family transcriptional regulator [Phenylobacterium glaciei]
MAKGPDAFRTISEAADELGVPQHVLRFWETKFSFIRPMKRAGGRRFYRPQDISMLRGVKTLLHEDGYTIKGVQRLHKEQGLKRLLSAASGRARRPRAGER